MMELLHWALMAIGVSYLITEATILTSFRTAFVRAARDTGGDGTGLFAAQLIYCPACIGLWVGLGLGALHWWPLNDSYWALSESAFASMALMATWSKLTGGNGAYEAEDPLDLEAPTENGALRAQEDTDD